jgi:hypothetical protein
MATTDFVDLPRRIHAKPIQQSQPGGPGTVDADADAYTSRVRAKARVQQVKARRRPDGETPSNVE